MRENEIVTKTSAWLNTFLNREGYKLLKTEYVMEDGIRYLRIYIDLTEEEFGKRKETMLTEQKEQEPTGIPEDAAGKAADEEGTPEQGEEEGPPDPAVGINDCALVSRRLSKWLDKEDFIPDEYMLEVCSKGYLDDEK